MILQMFMCPTITKQDMMTSVKRRPSQTCFCMDHILIKDKAIRYGQLNAKHKQVTDIWHVIHLYWIQGCEHGSTVWSNLDLL